MAQYLRRKAALPHGVRIRWLLDSEIQAQGWNGQCDDFDSTDRFEIRISSHLSAYHAWDLICHELAHVRQRIFRPNEREDHGQGWGEEHAFIWRRVVGEKDSDKSCEVR